MASMRQSASAKSRLQANADALAYKRQREYENMSKWNSQTQYYQNWDRHNNLYQTWTSPEYYTTSTIQYDNLKHEENKKLSLETRRKKLQKLLFEEEQEFETELTLSPRNRNKSNIASKSTEVLKEINAGLKLAEEDRKRHEAEIKLYQQWRTDNPIIRNYESNQNKSSLKLAWLDQQIEKRMEKEKTEEEIRKFIEQRDKAIKEEEILEKEERERFARTEKQMMEEIQLKMQQFKLCEEYAEKLKNEECTAVQKKNEINDLITKRNQELKLRKEKEQVLYNSHQSRQKLRQKAAEIEIQLLEDRKIIDEIMKKQTLEAIENKEKKEQIKKTIEQFLKYVREHQEQENERRKYISLIFDSEAKNLWEKQDRLWRSEQESREKLLQIVLTGIQEQIEEKINRNFLEQQQLLHEREEMFKKIEEQDKQMKKSLDEMKQKQIERKMALDKQVFDKKLEEKQKQYDEERKRNEELENIKKEEEKIKQEIFKLQKRQYPQQTRFNRRIIW